MVDVKNQYVETTNLYWEMLWKAQKIEDKKLVALIRKRLAELPMQTQTIAAGCHIIAFPLPPVPVPQSQEALQAFWPTQPLITTLSFIAGYCLLMITCVFTKLS